MERGGTLRREGLFALVLAAIAGLRIGLFSLAFPFFSNVDEYRHLDVVIKYSHGYWPTPGPDAYEKELAWWIGMYNSKTDVLILLDKFRTLVLNMSILFRTDFLFS